jgi:DNA-binding LacI/PurR family transcriptional regulator
MKKQNLRTIAERLKLSPMTVSRALSGKGPVSDSVRELVLREAGKLNFKARTRKTPGRVLFMADDLSRANYFSNVCSAAMSMIPGSRFNCSLVSLDPEPPAFDDEVKAAEIIVFVSARGADYLDRIRGLNPAAKIISAFSGGGGDVSVDPDDFMGGRIAAEHLVSREVRHAAVCSNLKTPNYLDRYKSFLSTFMTLRPDGKVDLIEPDQSGGLFEKSHAVFERYFSGASPDAVFCVGSCHTAVCCNYLTGSGKRIPADIGLLGYDEDLIYNALPVKISRIIFDPAKLAVIIAFHIRNIADMSGGARFRTLLEVQLSDYGSVKNIHI